MSYTLTKRSIKTCGICGKKFIQSSNSQIYCSSRCCKKATRANAVKKESPIGNIVTCDNPKCNNTFVKKTGMHRFCCVQCREMARGLPKPKKKLKYKTINEVLETMKLMGYTKSYGMFCAEHPEALVKEI